MRIAWGAWPYARALAERRRGRELEAQRREVGPDGWTCHVCGDYRPDALIGVHTNRRVLEGGVVMHENVRFCVDRPECQVGALTKTFARAVEA